MSHLTALEPYQPVFVAFTLGMLGIGYYNVYRKPKNAAVPALVMWVAIAVPGWPSA